MIRMVVSLEGGNSAKIYYLSASPSKETTTLIRLNFRCTEVLNFYRIIILKRGHFLL
jgi:hypothetical protein